MMTEDTMQASAETTAIATKNNHEKKFKEDVIEAIQEHIDKNFEAIALIAAVLCLVNSVPSKTALTSPFVLLNKIYSALTLEKPCLTLSVVLIRSEAACWPGLTSLFRPGR